MNMTEFQRQSVDELANLVQANKVEVCGFTFNGTRRWFRLENPHKQHDVKAYIQALSQSVVDICAILFDHGLTTLILPVISPHVMKRRDDNYQQMAIQALKFLVSNPIFLHFYEKYEVEVHLYGDYHTYLPAEMASYLSRKQAQLNQGQNGRSRRLFFGICAHDAQETITQKTIEHYQTHGVAPTNDDLIKAYYGAPIPPLDLYIGSSKPQTIDMPLISNGRESLYFTVAPSPYFNPHQLREILYDHIYQRNEVKDHARITAVKEAHLRQFYLANQNHTLGVGMRNPDWDVWHPLPQVALPKSAPITKPTEIPAPVPANRLKQIWDRTLMPRKLALDTIGLFGD